MEGISSKGYRYKARGMRKRAKYNVDREENGMMMKGDKGKERISEKGP